MSDHRGASEQHEVVEVGIPPVRAPNRNAGARRGPTRSNGHHPSDTDAERNADLARTRQTDGTHHTTTVVGVDRDETFRRDEGEDLADRSWAVEANAVGAELPPRGREEPLARPPIDHAGGILAGQQAVWAGEIV